MSKRTSKQKPAQMKKRRETSTRAADPDPGGAGESALGKTQGKRPLKVRLRNGVGVVLIGLLVLIGVVEHWHDMREIDQDRMEKEETKQTLLKWGETLNSIPTLPDDAEVKVFYAEHLLASWVLERSPWNAFHSGMVFEVDSTHSATTNERRAKVKDRHTIEFIPIFTDTVSYVIHPIIDPVYPSWMPRWAGRIFSRLTASYDLVWQNGGGVRYHKGVPSKFTNFTRIGTTDGRIFNGIVKWIREEYAPRHTTFEPVEIVLSNSSRQSDASQALPQQGIIGQGNIGILSSMCHDLSYSLLSAMTDLGMKPKPSDYFFRDHIMVFANSYKLVDENTASVRRAIVRYFRLVTMWMGAINEEFTSIRGLFVSMDLVSFTPYLYLGKKYYQVNLVEPYVNYCYLPIEMPPEKSNVWDSERLCALEMQISKHNSTLIEKATAFFSLGSLHYIVENVIDSMHLWTILIGSFVALSLF